MSIARGYGLNGKSYYTNVAKPMDTNLTFSVAAANANGLGITSLKSNGFVESVFMHTSQTPGKVNNVTNPNPPVGYAIVRFKNNFNFYLNSYSGIVSVLASTNLTTLAANTVYVITSLGTTTAAQWLAAGVPAGFTPAVGLAFTAIRTGALGGTGTFGAPGVSANTQIAIVGDPNQSIANSNIAQNAGAQLMLQFLAPTSSSVTTPIATNPADGSLVSLMFRFDGSSVTIDGL